MRRRQRQSTPGGTSCAPRFCPVGAPRYAMHAVDTSDRRFLEVTMKSILSSCLALLLLTLVIAACSNQPNGSGVSTGATPAAKSAGEAPVATAREAVKPGVPPIAGAAPAGSPSP